MLNFLFPRTCCLCNHKSDNSYDLCTLCQRELPWLQKACISCALPIENYFFSEIPLYCAECLKQPPPFTKTISPFIYEFPIDFMIIQLKFNHNLVYAHLLATLLFFTLKQYYTSHKLPQVIIPVPLHPKRLKHRGFNQSLEIAQPISKKLNIPIDTKHAWRHIYTQPQANLSATQRNSNLKQAFAAANPFPYQHIALIDDVITTGATIRAFAKTLIKAGATHIDVWCCARTP